MPQELDWVTEEKIKLGDYEKDFFYWKNDDQVDIMDIKEAFSKYGDILKKNFGKLLNEDDKFRTFWNAGVFVYVPSNTVCNVLLSLFSKSSSNPVFSRLLFFVDKNSEITIIESPDKNKKSVFYGKAVEIFVGENSKVNYVDLRESNQKRTINIKKGSADRNAVLNWVTVEVGGSDSFDEITTFLNGEGAKTRNLSAFLGDKEQQIGLSVKAVHNARRTESRLLTKGAVAGNSRANFRGLIEIAENSKNSDGYQKLEALILNEGAKVDTAPDLLIKNNDVRCSHGSSVSQIDDEKMFYLNSRGISEKTAKKMIVEGVFASILSEIKNDKMQKEIIKTISYKLGA